jgi:hypothetical protein
MRRVEQARENSVDFVNEGTQNGTSRAEDLSDEWLQDCERCGGASEASGQAVTGDRRAAP